MNARDILKQKTAEAAVKNTIQIPFSFTHLKLSGQIDTNTHIEEENMNIITDNELELKPRGILAKLSSLFIGFFVFRIFQQQKSINSAYRTVCIESEKLVLEEETLRKRIQDAEMRIVKLESAR